MAAAKLHRQQVVPLLEITPRRTGKYVSLPPLQPNGDDDVGCVRCLDSSLCEWLNTRRPLRAEESSRPLVLHNSRELGRKCPGNALLHPET